ncbi:hypothetical protein BV133_1983 [Blastochloris viridis]|uniref:Uncharacterized protein n=1 Tax=Blastochloris viridis TaxID=1079 RepID=A0A182D231_BLAVI|nr:hypothetical protein BV133_1983 [Blastochloris viridis]
MHAQATPRPGRFARSTLAFAPARQTIAKQGKETVGSAGMWSEKCWSTLR